MSNYNNVFMFTIQKMAIFSQANFITYRYIYTIHEQDHKYSNLSPTLPNYMYTYNQITTLTGHGWMRPPDSQPVSTQILPSEYLTLLPCRWDIRVSPPYVLVLWASVTWCCRWRRQGRSSRLRPRHPLPPRSSCQSHLDCFSCLQQKEELKFVDVNYG